MTRLVPLSLLLVGACSAGGVVNGTVDGTPLGSGSAIFDRVSVDVPLLGTASLALITVTDLPDACGAVQDLLELSEGGDCEDVCASLVDVADAHLRRDEHWMVTLAVYGAGSLEGEHDHGGVGTDLEGYNGTLTRIRRGPIADVDTCVETCRDGGDGTEDETSTGGSLTLDTLDDERADGSFTLDFGGDEVNGRFRAEACDVLDASDLGIPGF